MNPSFGKTSPMVSGPNVANAMESGAPGLAQQGPSSPGSVPQTQQNPLPGHLPSPTNPFSIMPHPQPQGAMPAGGQKAPPVPKSEAELIIEALINHLEKIGDHREHILKVVLPLEKELQAS